MKLELERVNQAIDLYDLELDEHKYYAYMSQKRGLIKQQTVLKHADI